MKTVGDEITSDGGRYSTLRARGDSYYAHRCGFAPKDNTFGKLHSRTAEETSRANSSDFITSKPRGKEYCPCHKSDIFRHFMIL